MQQCEPNQLLNPLIALIKKTGQAILAIYRQSAPLTITTKQDHSPVTQADIMAHRLLTQGLLALTPQLPIISEEAKATHYHERQHWSYYWLIDPLDGTKEFISRTGEFAINIALIHHHKPILGIVYAPVFDECFYAIHGQGAWKHVDDGAPIALQTKPCADQPIQILVSRHHNPVKLDRVFTGLPTTLIYRGSALKICNIAEGIADIYPRLGETSEWDTAAGQCILEEAGGALMDIQGNPLVYNKESLVNPPFLAIGDPSYPWLTALHF